MSQMKILLACYGGGHVNMIVPLYRRLKENSVDVKIFAFTMAQNKLDQLGIPYFRFLDFVEIPEYEDAVELGKRLCSNLELSPLIDKEESYAYMGVGYTDLIIDMGEQLAEKVFSQNGRKSFLPTYFMSKVLDLIAPNVVLATNSPRAEKAILLAAKEKQTRSICLVDVYDKFEISDRLGNPDYCDKICVSMDIIKQHLVKNGWNKEDVIVTGNPAFDGMKDVSLKERSASLRKRLKLGDKKVVLFVKNNFDLTRSAEESMINKLQQLKHEVGNLELLCRPHPNDNENYSLEEQLYVGQGYDLYELLTLSSVVVHENSTVGLEGYLLGKKVIQMDYINHPNKVSADETGIGIAAKSETEVLEFVKRFLNECEEVALDNEGVIPGKSATDLVIDQILGLVPSND